ncbi:MAG: hypothetical protein V9G10_03735 [Candidatus Nanopelagicales bacterium]
MADYRAIMTLVLLGRSYRDVVAAVGCSHRDVAAARKVIAARGITGTGLAQMSDSELAGLFPDGRAKVSDRYRGAGLRGGGQVDAVEPALHVAAGLAGLSGVAGRWPQVRVFAVLPSVR